MCGGQVLVPEMERPAESAPGRMELTCKDCGKSFAAPAAKRGAVVNCPSCGSWVKTGQGQRSFLYRNMPIPFQLSSSILGWLRFFAGANLLCGLAAAVWIGVFHVTRWEEIGEGVRERVVNPLAVLGMFAAIVEAVVGTLVLMALYWILRNVIAIHYNTRQSPEEPGQ